MKKLLVILLSLVMIFSVGCSSSTEDIDEDISQTNEIEEESVDSETIKISFPGGAPALSVAKLAVEEPVIDENIDIEYEFLSTPDLLASKVLKEEADIAIVPSNLAAQAYNKEIPYNLVGTVTWGTLHLISTEEIDGFNDLKGKEIYSFAKDLTPDLVSKYAFSQNGINLDEDVNITYLSSASEVGPAFLGGKTDLAILSEPVSTNVLMKNPDAKIILDFNEEWINITGIESGYPQASLIIKSELVDNDREFVDKFIEAYVDSQEWAKSNPEELGEYAEEMDIGMKKDMVVNGIDRMNIGPLSVDKGKEAYEIYYNMLLENAPEVIGGKLPDEGFYFER